MRETDSLTHLLKAHRADISAVKANKILMAVGVLEERQRPSTKDPSKMKKFKALTEKGLHYGTNRENLSNPNETSPYYYVSEFEQLLKLIMAHR